MKLPGPIAIIKEDDRNEMEFQALLDLGKYFMHAELNYKHTGVMLNLNLNYIYKEDLSHDKLINYLGFASMRYKGESAEEWYLIHFVKSFLIYSANKFGRYESKKAQYAADEILFNKEIGLVVFK